MVEKLRNGMIKVGVSQKDLEDSIVGLEQLKPILQAQVIKCNGHNRSQGVKDAFELGKHFNTAIDSMKILLSGFDDYRA